MLLCNGDYAVPKRCSRRRDPELADYWRRSLRVSQVGGKAIGHLPENAQRRGACTTVAPLP